MRYTHTGIVSADPERLAEFYVRVLGCTVSGPRRDLAGDVMERGMGLPGAHVRGIHLALPGYGAEAPVLEIFELPEMIDADRQVNRHGLMHMAFSVENIEETLDALLTYGGSSLGVIADCEVDGVGTAAFVYARDPDGNIVELQQWR